MTRKLFVLLLAFTLFSCGDERSVGKKSNIQLKPVGEAGTSSRDASSSEDSGQSDAEEDDADLDGGEESGLRIVVWIVERIVVWMVERMSVSMMPTLLSMMAKSIPMRLSWRSSPRRTQTIRLRVRCCPALTWT